MQPITATCSFAACGFSFFHSGMREVRNFSTSWLSTWK